MTLATVLLTIAALVLGTFIGLLTNWIKRPERLTTPALVIVLLLAMAGLAGIYVTREVLDTPGPNSSSAPAYTTSPTPSQGTISNSPAEMPASSGNGGQSTPGAGQATTPTVSARVVACQKLRDAALAEESALRSLRSNIDVNEAAGDIEGPGPGYDSIYANAVSAVDLSRTRLVEYEQQGGSLPPMGEVDFSRDLSNLRDFELARVNDGVKRTAAYDKDADYNAWNQLSVYADNAGLVASIQCQ